MGAAARLRADRAESVDLGERPVRGAGGDIRRYGAFLYIGRRLAENVCVIRAPGKRACPRVACELRCVPSLLPTPAANPGSAQDPPMPVTNQALAGGYQLL